MTRDIIARRLGSRWCCAWQVVLTLFVLGLLFSASWSQGEGLAGYLDSVGRELLADAVASLVVMLAAATVLRSRNERTQRVVVVVLVWVGIALVRGLVMAALAPNDLVRITNSNVTIPIWALVVIYLFAAYDETRTRAAELGVANSSLLEVQNDTQATLMAERQRLVAAVQDGISAEIEQLKNHVAVLAQPGSEGELSDLADRVAAYSSDVVRETSHQLRRPDDAVLGVALLPGVAHVRKTSLFSAYLRARQPIWIPMALIISKGVSVWLFRWDSAPFRSQPVAFGLMVIAMWSGRALIERFLRRPAIVEFVASTTLIVVTAGIVMWGFAATRGDVSGSQIIPLPTVGLYIVGIFLAARLLAAVQLRWNAVSGELEQVNRQLAEANAQLRDQLAETRERLADVLHGPVQGRLAAASMALRLYADARNEGRSVDYAATVATTVELLDRALIDLGQLGRPSEGRWRDVQSGVAHISQMWAPLVDVTWRVEDEWQRSGLTVDRIVHLVDELVTNSSRHADARSIDITIHGIDPVTVSVTAIDDGSGPTTDLVVGSGLGSVSRFGGTWSMDRLDDETTRVSLLLRAE